jgi:hypothetical protein
VKRWLAQELVIGSVRADLKPSDAAVFRRVNAHRSMVETNSTRPEAADLLEMERRVARLGLEQLELLVRQLLKIL